MYEQVNEGLNIFLTLRGKKEVLSVIEVKFRVSKQKLLLYCVCVTDKSAAIFYLFDKIGASEVFTCSTRF